MLFSAFVRCSFSLLELILCDSSFLEVFTRYIGAGRFFRADVPEQIVMRGFWEPMRRMDRRGMVRAGM